MSFDYPYTCPDIDSNIRVFKEALEQFLGETYDEMYEYYIESDMEDLAPKDVWVKANIRYVYDFSEDVFEDLRKVNQNMRDSAEKQIDGRLEEISELEHTISELTVELERLQEE